MESGRVDDPVENPTGQPGQPSGQFLTELLGLFGEGILADRRILAVGDGPHSIDQGQRKSGIGLPGVERGVPLVWSSGSEAGREVAEAVEEVGNGVIIGPGRGL